MKQFAHLYLDKEKDIPVFLYLEGEEMYYEIRTLNHASENLITNLARICNLPVSKDAEGKKIIQSVLPCYFHPTHKRVYIFRLRDTKIANIYPDGTIETKALIPSIAKTLMSQTKQYHLPFQDTVVKTYIETKYKFQTDLHTHLNSNLKPDILIAIGIFHEIRYPLYYIKKLKLRLTDTMWSDMLAQREEVAKQFTDYPLQGKYLERKIDDAAFMNFRSLILDNLENADYNIPRIRASLAIMKDGQAVFTNLEKVYLYRYVFTKGAASSTSVPLHDINLIPDEDIVSFLHQMQKDQEHPVFKNNSLYQNKLLWIGRTYQAAGIVYTEISDTNLIKPKIALDVLDEIHAVMPAIYEETHVRIRFLAAFRRIPLTIIRDHPSSSVSIHENLRVLESIMSDPYIAGCDIVGEEMNDIRQLKNEIRALTQIASKDPSFVLRIHAGENDSLKDNVANSIACIKDSLTPNQSMPHIRIGHGLYTADLKSNKGKALLRSLKENNVILEFQITSNVRLNNLSSLHAHPLKQYLKAGIACIQGTDGGALYGTDSVDEQLALSRLLNLTDAEMMQMCNTEKKVISYSESVFEKKMQLLNSQSIRTIAEKKYAKNEHLFDWMMEASPKILTSDVLKDKIVELPQEKKPIVLCGGSYNNDMHTTRLKKQECDLIDALLEQADPAKNYFVIGNTRHGYEKYLMKQNKGKFEIYSFVPSVTDEKTAASLKKEDLKYRIAVESEPMGLYKSVAYEVFKQRESILIALDGNSAASNLIQEANNSKYKCRIFVDEKCRMLKQKALNLQGYITLFSSGEILDEILKYTKR